MKLKHSPCHTYSHRLPRCRSRAATVSLEYLAVPRCNAAILTLESARKKKDNPIKSEGHPSAFLLIKQKQISALCRRRRGTSRRKFEFRILSPGMLHERYASATYVFGQVDVVHGGGGGIQVHSVKSLRRAVNHLQPRAFLHRQIHQDRLVRQVRKALRMHCHANNLFRLVNFLTLNAINL